MVEQLLRDIPSDQSPDLNITSHAEKGTPGYLLSNFANTPFYLIEIDENGHQVEVIYQSTEAFWQGLKYPAGSAERQQIAQLSGKAAKLAGDARPEGTNEVEYNGRRVAVGSSEHHALMDLACRAKVVQNREVLEALLATGNANLTHVVYDKDGVPYPDSVSIPAAIFTGILMRIRRELQEEQNN